MDSDPISESTPKRRRLSPDTKMDVQHEYGNESADDLFDDIGDTVPTQPLRQYKRPVGNTQTQATSRPSLPKQTQGPKPKGILAQTLAQIQGSSPQPYETQPTQPVDRTRDLALRSSPDVEVLASSPIKPPPSMPRASIMAPPGTSLRRPVGVAQQQPKQPTQANSQRRQNSQSSLDPAFDDPEIIFSDSDGEDELHQASIRPTSFKGLAQKQESRPFDVSQFAYTPSDDMAGAYGGRSRAPKPAKPPGKQGGPSRAAAVEVEMTVEDIPDSQDRQKVSEMIEILGTSRSVSTCYSMLKRKHNNKWDALGALSEEKGDVDELSREPIVITSDVESSPVSKPTASTKLDIKATQTIRQKQQAQQQNRRLLPRSEARAPEPDTPPKPKRRLVKGRRQKSPASEQEEEQIQILSDSSDTASPEPGPEPASGNRLLHFLNTCSSLELADLANATEAVAQQIVAKRPFKSVEALRKVDDLAPGKKTNRMRKTLGDKVLDVAEEMWEGYEAVDRLVEQCKQLGKPIMETMKKWGVNTETVSKSGELELTNLDDAHDSAIGTPASSIAAEDEAVTAKSQTHKKMLAQPENMSKDLVMKDYQVFGLNWLNLLWTKRLSCILADDMGLGKTCQVISFFAHLKETGQVGPHLVVVPGSTLENWSREFRNFCPDINVELYYGLQAEREAARYDIEESRSEIDVVITTYDIARNKEDNYFLRKTVRPRVCVFDEGHMLKNAASQRHRGLMRIPAEMRLLLTGTPLQNNLQELASLLGFILPELFEEASDDLNMVFKYKAATRDASHSALLSNQRIARARSMMAPFILRRKKAQVLSSLPAKTRRVEYCDMVPAQQALWDSLVAQAQADRVIPPTVRRRKATGSPETVHMTALRFAALHPLLLRNMYTDSALQKLQSLLLAKDTDWHGKKPELMWKYLTTQLKGGDFALHTLCSERPFIPPSLTLQSEEWMTLSGKIPVLQRLLETWLPQGHRVLLFSQFTTLLDILEAVLNTLNIKFCRLDGATPMAARQDLIDTFTADRSIGVFMLSTKAGGAGINLAAADKVVIMEGGFNPQDEIQAENRAHRVGQTREVEVVRLVMRGTVEELILRLGESKLALDERVTGEAQGGKDDGEAVVKLEEGEDGGSKVEDVFFGEMSGEKTLEEARERLRELYPRLEIDRAESMEVDGGEKEVRHPQLDEGGSQESRGKRKRKTRKAELVEEDTESEDEKPAKARAKKGKAEPKSQGADISRMFRRGLRGRGVDVGD